MISVVYCTKESNPKHKEHIVKTSGLKDIEVIEYVNHGESLTKFYNRGLNESKNDIVVFMHDDVNLDSKNWSKKLISHFENTDFGVLGVAGTTDLPETGRWWDDTTKMMGQVRHTQNGKYWDSIYCSNFGEKVLNAVIVDGLFFAVKKDRLKSRFNEFVEGFHFYEIDFCFNNILNGCKVGVMSNIRVTHKSVGMTNDQWETNRLQFVETYKDNLPYSVGGEIIIDNNYSKLKETPHVGVIIPTKGNVDLLTKCIDSIWEKDHYPLMTVYIADTGSSEDEKNQIRELITKHSLFSDRPRNMELIEYDYYNFSKINNDVVWNHVSNNVDVLLFCNNDIELMNNAISKMVSVITNTKGVGTVGARLHYEDNMVQHSGIMVFLGQDRRVNLSHKGLRSYYGYHNSNKEVFGNTAAFMMIKKDIFNKIGGFNQGYKECFEDVELNVDCLTRNLKNIFVHDAVCYHYESQTRKNDPKRLERESEDYTKRIIPYIITNKKTYNYFENVSVKDLEFIIGNTMKNLV